MEMQHYTLIVSDNALITSFRKAYDKVISFDKNVGPIKVSISHGLSPYSLDIPDTYSWDSDEIKILKDADSVAISNISIVFNHFDIRFERTPNDPQKVKGQLGLLLLSINDETGLTIKEHKEIFKILTRGLMLVSDINPNSSVVNSHALILSEMEALTLNIQQDSQDFRKRIEEDFYNKKIEIEKSADEKIGLIKNQYDKKEAALKGRERSLDDRGHTHVRREIRERIKERIRDNIDNIRSSTSVSILRWPVHISYILLIVSSSLGAYYYSHAIFTQKYGDPTKVGMVIIILALLKPLTLTCVFTSSFIFYIKWLNNWFNKKSEEELYLRKYQLDIERASWVVETVLEGMHQKGKELPKELIINFSKDLFYINKDKSSKSGNPVDQLASAIFGSASRVSLDVAGNRVEFDKKSMKKMSKESIED